MAHAFCRHQQRCAVCDGGFAPCRRCRLAQGDGEAVTATLALALALALAPAPAPAFSPNPNPNPNPCPSPSPNPSPEPEPGTRTLTLTLHLTPTRTLTLSLARQSLRCAVSCSGSGGRAPTRAGTAPPCSSTLIGRCAPPRAEARRCRGSTRSTPSWRRSPRSSRPSSSRATLTRRRSAASSPPAACASPACAWCQGGRARLR